MAPVFFHVRSPCLRTLWSFTPSAALMSCSHPWSHTSKPKCKACRRFGSYSTSITPGSQGEGAFAEARLGITPEARANGRSAALPPHIPRTGGDRHPSPLRPSRSSSKKCTLHTANRLRLFPGQQGIGSSCPLSQHPPLGKLPPPLLLQLLLPLLRLTLLRYFARHRCCVLKNFPKSFPQGFPT